MSGVPALKKLKTSLAQTLTLRGHLIGLDRRPLYCRSDFKALNVLLQGAGAVLMKQVVINIHNALTANGLKYGEDWHQHAMIHDEVQMSCRPELTGMIEPLVLQAYEDAGNFLNSDARLKVM